MIADTGNDDPLGDSNPMRYVVTPVPYRTVAGALDSHYLGGTTGAIFTLTDALGAVAVFTNLRSRNLTRSFPNSLELSRLYAPPSYPHGMLSRFVGAVLRWLKHNTSYTGVISYTDPNVGHRGTIYRASNWVFDGVSSKDGHPQIYIDGRNVPPRTLYNRHGTQSVPVLQKIYGERMTTGPKLPKLRFYFRLRKDVS